MKVRERKTLEIAIDEYGCDLNEIIPNVIKNDVANRYPNSVVIGFDCDGLMDRQYDDNNQRITKGVLYVTVDTYKDITDETIDWWGLQTHEPEDPNDFA